MAGFDLAIHVFFLNRVRKPPDATNARSSFAGILRASLGPSAQRR